MARLFISHSSRDDAIATALVDWLHDNGFRDTFIDHHDIRGGDSWGDKLREQAASCRVVLCLMSPHWLASHECFSEFQAAWYMGKRILPLFLLDPDTPPEGEAARRFARVAAETQGIDLRPLLADDGSLDVSRDPGLTDHLGESLRAAGVLSDVGLDPTVFAIDRASKPTPFPGLVSFGDDDADAAIFYGRSLEISEAIEELRSMRANADRRPLVILGMSGAGKSSLLKAGILPRLRRERPSWLPLRSFRPGHDPLGAFAAGLARSFADFDLTEAPGSLRRQLQAAWDETCAHSGERPDASDSDSAPSQTTPLSQLIDGFGQKLRKAAGCPDATILIPLDQAEELVRSDAASAAALCACLNAALSGQANWRLAYTVRTDSFPELQAHPGFRGLKARGYDLRPLPPFRFSDVIEGPAERYGVTLDPRLVETLMSDAPERDALPILAFALQRLWDQFSPSGAMTLDDYRALGGVSGLVRDAGERALAGMPPEDFGRPLPREVSYSGRIALAEQTFVPGMVDLRDGSVAIRRMVPWNDLSDPAQTLLEDFERWRLVTRRTEAGTVHVEVAHDALFREWDRLHDWLKPEIDRIGLMRDLRDAARQWDRQNRQAGFLVHRGARLAEARALRRDARYADRMGATENAYLDACDGLVRRQRLTFAAVTALVVVALGLSGLIYFQSGKRLEQQLEAEFLALTLERDHQGSPEIAENIVDYVFEGDYPRTRPDRFSVLRQALTTAPLKLSQTYGMARQIREAVEAPLRATFELEYSPQLRLEETAFHVLWRTTARDMIQSHAFPVPLGIKLAANAELPPGALRLLRDGRTVHETVLPGTQMRYILDVTELDTEPLIQFFAEFQDEMTPAPEIGEDGDYYFVPNWTVPVWNHGRNENTDGRLDPPTRAVVTAIEKAIFANPEIVLDTAATEAVLNQLPANFDMSVAELRLIRGARLKDDFAEWVRRGYSLQFLSYYLREIASLGPNATSGEVLDWVESPDPLADLILRGRVLAIEEETTETPDNTPDEPLTEGGPVDATEELRLKELADSTALMWLDTRFVRLHIPEPDPDAGWNNWSRMDQALFDPGMTQLALSDKLLRSISAAREAVLRDAGVYMPGVRVITTNLPDNTYRYEFMWQSVDSLSWWNAEETIDTSLSDTGIRTSMMARLRDAVGEVADVFVTQDDAEYRLTNVSDARADWLLQTFSHTDIARLMAGFSSRMGGDGHAGEASILLHADWLMGALPFSVVRSGMANGDKHLDLWRDLLAMSRRPELQVPVTPLPADIHRLVFAGLEQLDRGNIETAMRIFARANHSDEDAALAVFQIQYLRRAPAMVLDRLRARCDATTDGDLNMLGRVELRAVLDGLSPLGVTVPADERAGFEICYLSATGTSDPVIWLNRALALTRSLPDAEALSPDDAIWLGRTMLQLYDPNDPARAAPDIPEIARRFLLDGLRRTQDVAARLRVGGNLMNDCHARSDVQVCARRVIEIAETLQEPDAGLDAAQFLAVSGIASDRRRAVALFDWHDRAYGTEPAHLSPEDQAWRKAYMLYVRGISAAADAASDQTAMDRALAYMTRAAEHQGLRRHIVVDLIDMYRRTGDFDTARTLLTDSIAANTDPKRNVETTTRLRHLAFLTAVEANLMQDELATLIAVTDETGCEKVYDGVCVAPWLWRGFIQTLTLEGDWQGLGRHVIDNVDHPYSLLIALIRHAQLARQGTADDTLDRIWAQVDPTGWTRRIQHTDEAVWREMLTGYALGHEVPGFEHDTVMRALQSDALFSGHVLSQIGLGRKLLLTEALFYGGIERFGAGDTDAAQDLLMRTRQVGLRNALEFSYAKLLLDREFQ